MQPKTEKAVISTTCFLGISGVVYGMIKENHPVFLAGLFFVVAGYLLIRKKLKSSDHDR